jgi:tRNA-Thr(GGU) m(6)t(6)A37 methyltransferase TsaA
MWTSTTIIIATLTKILLLLNFIIKQLNHIQEKCTNYLDQLKNNKIIIQLKNNNSTNNKPVVSKPPSQQKLPTFPTTSFIIIGHAETVFPERYGTPRQGTLCPSSRGLIRLNPKVVDPEHSLLGLDDFSHVWILFTFDSNTNKQKQAKRTILGGKVRPPQADGERVGVFASRSPHRPNIIGLSLCKIHRVDYENGILYLEGVDLVNGTPILDIKPYVNHVDQPLVKAKTPSWVTNPEFSLVPVEWTTVAEESLEKLAPIHATKWYKPEVSELLILKSALNQMIALDPRDVIRGRGKFDETIANATIYLRFAGLRVHFHALANERKFIVTHVSEDY